MENQKDDSGCAEVGGLQVRDLHKSYGVKIALAGISFQVKEKEIVAVLGPSGCGKSTVLAIIAGLEKPDLGEVCWNGFSVLNTPVHQRGFGLMFQDFALFPHRNVFDNVAFGLQMRNAGQEELKHRVEQVLALVGLSGFERRDVNILSGGEIQRVALARALAPIPRLLMLDEPLGSLDRSLRERLMLDLRQILKKSQQTAIYVTHDQEEAFAISDRIVLMNAGRIAQVGTPHEIYHQPQSVFAARFLGLENLLQGEIRQKDGGWEVETPLGAFPFLPVSGKLEDTGQVFALLRPDEFHLGGQGEKRLKGRVSQISFRGTTNRVFLQMGDQTLSFDFKSSIQLPQPGEELELSFDPRQAIQVIPE